MNTQTLSSNRARALALAAALLAAGFQPTARAGDSVTLGQVIAAQGNAALVQIRSEAARIPMPDLPAYESAVVEKGPADGLRTRIRSQGDRAAREIRAAAGVTLYLPPAPAALVAAR